MKMSHISKLLSISIILIFLLSPVAVAGGLQPQGSSSLDGYDQQQDSSLQTDAGSSYQTDTSAYSEDTDVGSFLSDHDNTYAQKWDPWKSKAAIHAVATSDDGDYFALGGGYLYDNEVHLYRWNPEKQDYSLVWEVGGDVFQSDIMALDFADTDHNNFTEIIVGTQAGFVYVFEQTHIYDPNTNMENQFELVWQSERLGRIFDLMVQDTDGDYKKDIIVGTANTIRHYEYSDHSGYPFADDHWIEFEEVFSYQVSSFITSLGVVDANSNGLLEVAVGQDNGKIVLLENNGTVLDANGQPYPVLQDNSYKPVWDSGNTIRRSVSDMTGGDLDQDGIKELVVAVQGQGAYILDTFDSEIGVFKLHRVFDDWESTGGSPYTLDYELDFVKNTSSLQSGSDGGYTYWNDYNVYFHNATGDYPEPLNNSALNNPVLNPFRSAAVEDQDSAYTYFNASNRDAWAIFDWGQDEEASSNGIATMDDFELITEDTLVNPSDIQLSVSANGIDYYQISSDNITVGSGKYTVEVDPTLESSGLDYYRYLKVNVTGGVLKVDAVNTYYVNNRIYDALSTEVGSLTFKDDTTPTTTGFVGTIDGTILGITHDSTNGGYEINWDSWKDERYKLQENIFDLAVIKKSGNFPALIKNELSYEIDLDNNLLPDSYRPLSYAAGNLMGTDGGRSQEILVTSKFGNIYVYTQSGPDGQPTLDPDARDQLLGNIKYLYNRSSAGSQADYDYISVSLIPMDFVYYETTLGTLIDPAEYPYMLLVSKWNGTMGALDSTSQALGDPSFDPYILNMQDPSNPTFESFPNLAGDFDAFIRSGQHQSIMDASTWMPKITSADMIGDSKRDLIMTNGRVHLMETNPSNPTELEIQKDVFVSNTELIDTGKVDNELYTSMGYYYADNYFEEINAAAEGRHWTNANPVNFDGDDDFDLVLGFARYDTNNFGFQQSTFGMTYWENEGSRSDPQWVEKRHGVVNIDPDSSLRSQRYSDPYFLYEDYDFGDLQISDFGYHPLYQAENPSKLLMFKVNSEAEVFRGKIQSFKTSYDHQQSLLAATYPEVKRLDINLEYNSAAGDTSINYGFHVFETWDNSEKLRNWTLSMDTADLDQDGKNEVIVGDFDNNIYVFEHLTNNTYKRAYESFDINRTVVTDQTPYAYEEFGGISGEFSRTIFQNIKYLTAGSDLNNNGRLEFIGATDSMIFIFESASTPTGGIRDDSFDLVQTIDLFSEPALAGLDDISITSLQTADDLTQDGRREIIVGSNQALLIYEINSQFNYVEIFSPDSLSGYNIPGNYMLQPDYEITSLYTGDLDQDGRQDLTIAGRDISNPASLQSGFATIIEWTGIEFVKMVDTTSFSTLNEFNPVSSLETADSDLDGFTELYIGHGKGVDIYEFTEDNTVMYRDSISSNPVYPYPDVSHFTDTLDRDELRPGFAITRVPNSDTLKMIYYVLNVDEKAGSTPKLRMATSTDNGTTWTKDGQVYVAGGETSSSSGTLIKYESLDLNYDSFGNLWFTYVAKRDYDSTQDVLDTYVVKNPVVGLNPSYLVFAEGVEKNEDHSVSQKLFNIYGNNDENVTGITFRSNLNGPSATYLLEVNITITTTWHYDDVYQMPFSTGVEESGKYNIHGMDIVQLQSSTSGLTSQYGLAFSGYSYDEKLSLDTDIFYTTFNLSDPVNWNFNATTPIKTFDAAYPTDKPTIIQEQSRGALMIAFETDGTTISDRVQSVWTRNGIQWNGPYNMIHPAGREEFDIIRTGGTSSYTIANSEGMDFVDNIFNNDPILVDGRNGGFYFAQNSFVSTSSLYDIGLCVADVDGYQGQDVFDRMNLAGLCSGLNEWAVSTMFNPTSDFTNVERINAVQDISLGDSDQDGRIDILIASGNQATLAEFASNSRTSISFVQKWLSDEYERPLTSVAISDANGNGYPELIIESSQGIVHSYEVVEKATPASLIYPSKTDEVSLTTDPGRNTVMDIYPTDINTDGFEDFIYATSQGQLVAIDGVTMSPMWTPAISGTGSNPAGTTRFLNDLILPVNESTSQEFGRVAMSHRSNLSLYDISDGSLINSMYFDDFIITAMTVGDLNPGGYHEIVIALENGTLVAFSGSDLSEIGRDTFLPGYSGFEFVMDLQIANVDDADPDLILTDTTGNVRVYDSEPGSSIIWDTSVPIDNLELQSVFQNMGYHPVPGIGLSDFNQDGYTDIVVSGNATFALDVYNQKQIWNNTDNFSIESQSAQDPLLRDINADGVDDVIYSNLYYQAGRTLVALDGKTGQEIWDYRASTDGSYQLSNDVEEATISFDNPEDVLLASVYGFDLTVSEQPQESFISILSSDGISQGAIPSDQNVLMDGMAVSLLGHDRPVILVGDYYGTVHIYGLWDSYQEPVQVPAASPGADPMTGLGEHISNFDGLDTASGFATADINGTSEEELLVFESGSVYAYDMARLVNNEPALIYENIIELGEYVNHLIDDINDDGLTDLLIGYEEGIVLLDIYEGSIIWRSTYVSGESFDFGTPTFTELEFDLMTISSIPYLVAAFTFEVAGDIYHGIRYYNPSNGNFVSGNENANLKSIHLTIDDITGDGLDEIVIVRSYSDNQHNLFIGNDTGNTLYSSFWTGIAPFTEIRSAELDTSISGKELLLSYDLSLVSTSTGLKPAGHPTKFLALGYQDAANQEDRLVLPSGDTFLAISGTSGPMRDLWLSDIDTDGDQDILTESQDGSLSSMTIDATSSVLYPSTGSQSDLVHPAAMIQDTVIGDFCGTQSLITMINPGTIACYDNLNLGLADIGYTLDVDISQVLTLVPGNFDGDTIDDVMIIGIKGEVYLHSSSPVVLSSLEADDDQLQSPGSIQYDNSQPPLLSSLASMMSLILVIGAGSRFANRTTGTSSSSQSYGNVYYPSKEEVYTQSSLYIPFRQT